jgi:glycerophosphoryl diester phosphodiesterase
MTNDQVNKKEPSLFNNGEIKIMIFLTMGVFIIAFFLNMTKKNSRRAFNESAPIPLRIAHRGAAGHCPENTLISFKKAVELGADLIEIDVQLSSDGKIIVIHDDTMERTTNGKGKVKECHSKAMRKLDAGSWFHQDFTGESIPFLEEVLEKVLPDAGVLIEIKNPSLYPGIEQRLADELKKWLHHTGKTNAIMVQSFDIGCIKRFHTLLPSIPAGILFKYVPFGISGKKLRELSSFADFINIKRSMMSLKLAAKIRAYGMKVFTWTVNDPEEIEKFVIMNIDGITTDYPDYFTRPRA